MLIMNKDVIILILKHYAIEVWRNCGCKEPHIPNNGKEWA